MDMGDVEEVGLLVEEVDRDLQVGVEDVDMEVVEVVEGDQEEEEDHVVVVAVEEDQEEGHQANVDQMLIVPALLHTALSLAIVGWSQAMLQEGQALLLTLVQDNARPIITVLAGLLIAQNLDSVRRLLSMAQGGLGVEGGVGEDVEKNNLSKNFQHILLSAFPLHLSLCKDCPKKTGLLQFENILRS